MNLQRVHKLNHKEALLQKPVAYWMSRDQRVDENWALIFACQKAKMNNVPLYVFFALTPGFLGATLRQYDFMIQGLQEVEKSLQKLGICFVLTVQSPEKGIVNLVEEYDIGTLVCDFSSLRIGREWRNKIADQMTCAMYEVDAHNIVPCRIASQKQEYAAYTIRPKIHSLLPVFLDTYPKLDLFIGKNNVSAVDWEYIRSNLQVDTSVKPVSWAKPGSSAAKKELTSFINKKLYLYVKEKNNTSINAQSNLSPYLHFGQISAQFVAQEILKAEAPQEAKDSFLEELVVRRELADNFCYYNNEYDSFEGFPSWAKKTLQKHLSDQRNVIYSREQLESAKTEDPVWNYAQLQMVETGKMHGYLRMYWAKKLLEWTKTPQEAVKIAIYLNDKYELDGRDPNGYVGIAWSIGGVHDRPWFERDIYGMIRYMASTKIKKQLHM